MHVGFITVGSDTYTSVVGFTCRQALLHSLCRTVPAMGNDGGWAGCHLPARRRLAGLPVHGCSGTHHHRHQYTHAHRPCCPILPPFAPCSEGSFIQDPAFASISPPPTIQIHSVRPAPPCPCHACREAAHVLLAVCRPGLRWGRAIRGTGVSISASDGPGRLTPPLPPARLRTPPACHACSAPVAAAPRWWATSPPPSALTATSASWGWAPRVTPPPQTPTPSLAPRGWPWAWTPPASTPPPPCQTWPS